MKKITLITVVMMAVFHAKSQTIQYKNELSEEWQNLDACNAETKCLCEARVLKLYRDFSDFKVSLKKSDELYGDYETGLLANVNFSMFINLADIMQSFVNCQRMTDVKFIRLLLRKRVINTQMVGTEKFVSVKPSILQWVDCSQNKAQRLRGDSFPSQPSSSQSSSSERREDLSSGEKSLEV